MTHPCQCGKKLPAKARNALKMPSKHSKRSVGRLLSSVLLRASQVSDEVAQALRRGGMLRGVLSAPLSSASPAPQGRRGGPRPSHTPCLPQARGLRRGEGSTSSGSASPGQPERGLLWKPEEGVWASTPTALDRRKNSQPQKLTKPCGSERCYPRSTGKNTEAPGSDLAEATPLAKSTKVTHSGFTAEFQSTWFPSLTASQPGQPVPK